MHPRVSFLARQAFYQFSFIPSLKWYINILKLKTTQTSNRLSAKWNIIYIFKRQLHKHTHVHFSYVVSKPTLVNLKSIMGRKGLQTQKDSSFVQKKQGCREDKQIGERNQAAAGGN